MKAENGRLHEPSLREVVAQLDDFKELMAERDRRYEQRFTAQEMAVEKAFTANKESMAAAFMASEKAVSKAEDAQKEYNARSNEFRGQLDDQAKLLMPRAEANTRWAVSEEKIEDLKREVQNLRESRSEGTGRAGLQTEVRDSTHWLVSLGLLAVLEGLALLVAAATYFSRGHG